MCYSKWVEQKLLMAFGNYTVASEGLDSKQGEEKMFFFVFHHPHAALRLHFFY